MWLIFCHNQRYFPLQILHSGSFFFFQMWMGYYRFIPLLTHTHIHYNFYFLQICSRLIFGIQLLAHSSERYKILSITANTFNIMLSLSLALKIKFWCIAARSTAALREGVYFIRAENISQIFLNDFTAFYDPRNLL